MTAYKLLLDVIDATESGLFVLGAVICLAVVVIGTVRVLRKR